ncbi:MAG: hypothetical protein LV481_08545 [Methylacidiphilales bacterium]|nr:hypothetical protein [Candidatus Methylacidiphilales bacterium]
MNWTLEELKKHIFRNPVLVVGPGATGNPLREQEFLKVLLSRFPKAEGTPAPESFLTYMDLLLASSRVTDLDARKIVNDFLGNKIGLNPQLSSLLKANWRAVISLTFEDHAREALRSRIYANADNWTVTTVSEPAQSLPRNTIPYYALLGDPSDSRETARLAVSHSQYIARRRIWEKILIQLPDLIKGDPIIFIGTSSISDRVMDFLNELLRLAPKYPRELVFLRDDPTATLPSLINLSQGNFELYSVDCQIKDLGNELSKEQLELHELPLFSSTAHFLVDFKALKNITHVLGYVPKKEEIGAHEKEWNRLLDTLFRPSYLNWEPYALELPFKRDFENDIITTINAVLKANSPLPKAIWITGESGIGKTTTLRNCAYRVAQSGQVAMWVKSQYSRASTKEWMQSIEALNKGIKGESTPVVVFVDDPIGSSVNVQALHAALNTLKRPWGLIICSRRSEVLHREEELGKIKQTQLEMPADFSREEFSRLGSYLVTLKMATTPAEGESKLPATGSKHGRDVLCGLWFALPQTQASIADSLVGEYQRLMGAQEAIQAYIQKSSKQQIARIAYELVTTASSLDILLPVEVLVSALGISYPEWAQFCGPKTPLWGLIYDEELPACESYGYRTRNSVVTHILTNTLNKGSAGRAGEFRCLKLLLSACTSTSIQYKTFITGLLIDRRHSLENGFSLDQVTELYDVALHAFPKRMSSVEHHKALAQRNLGGDMMKVYQDLQVLIARTRDVVEEDQDSAVNLHTSSAATLVRMIKSGLLDAQENSSALFDHIRRAILDDQYSAHSHHVHAKSLFTIAQFIKSSNRSSHLEYIGKAWTIVNRSLMMLQEEIKTDHVDDKLVESLQLFNGLRDDIIAEIPDASEGRASALEYFKATKNQSLMVLVVRAMLAKATEKDRGGEFKKAQIFLTDCITTVEEAGEKISSSLFLCRIELVVNWMVNRAKGPVYWEQLESDLKALLDDPIYARDSLWRFYLAVAFYHQGRYPEAEMIFQDIRREDVPFRSRWAIRCWYLGDAATPPFLEGKIKSSTPVRRYIYSNDLENDVLAKNDEFNVADNDPCHFHVGFTLQGPLAVNRSTFDKWMTA